MSISLCPKRQLEPYMKIAREFQTHTAARLALEILVPQSCIVVEDGTWPERFADRLMDFSSAAAAAKEAILDDEVMSPEGLIQMLWLNSAIPREALAAALRTIWLNSGLHADAALITAIFRNAQKAKYCLMTPEEIEVLESLPELVTAYRGQLFRDGDDMISGASWTLSEEVANWYAAPVPILGLPMGWVFKTEVPKAAILAFFQERKEHEVVLDIAEMECVSSRGTCPSFPQHLTYPIRPLR